LIEKAWAATRSSLVIIEPGTMAGFAGIRASRAELIASGACIAAPCPHNLACPMPMNDWCHFAERLERTSLHRRMKSATLSYEDEKYSYVIACKQPCEQVEARILRHPGKHGGHISFELCTPEGLVKKTVTKKDKEAFRVARKLEWGDEFSL
jgi:ribosomal protein RSM22 (predicted rRNA methylase)